jgi:hypothetical protein
MTAQLSIRWPPGFDPQQCPVHVRNERSMPLAREAIWNCLIGAGAWSSWYPNASTVRFLDGTGPILRLRSSFQWKTFGVTIESQVLEFDPPERIGWDGRRSGLRVYHAWLLEDLGAVTRVLTEETQVGWVARLGQLVSPSRMHRGHALWLAALETQVRLAPIRRAPGDAPRGR